MALEALIFDVDGTLANTERDGHLVAFNQAFSELNLDWHWSNEQYHDLLNVTGGQLRIKHFLRTEKPDFSRPNLDQFVADIHALKTKIFVQKMNAGAVPLRPGIARLFAEARAAKMRLAIATTTTPANVEALISHTLGAQALDWFEVIGAGDCVTNLKPSGDIYRYVLDKLNLRPDQCLAFEDSDNGIIAATEAGLKTLITVNEYTQTHAFSGAIAVLDNLGEPDEPCHVIHGEPTKMIDVETLRKLYANHC